MGASLCRREAASTFDHQLLEYAKINDDLNKAVELAMGGSGLASRLLLKLKCTNLPNMDYLSLTDAFLVLFEYKKNSWIEVGRTEIVEDNLNPEFIKAIEVMYYFEENQKFKAAVYDADKFDNPNLSVKDANYIGEAEFEIQKLAASRNSKLEVNICDPNKAFHSTLGTLTITYKEAASADNQEISFTLKAENSDFSAGTSYFYIVGRRDPQVRQNFIPVMRSEIIKYAQGNDEWKMVTIPVSSLSLRSEEEIPLKEVEMQIQVFRHSKKGNHKMMGSYETTIIDFIESGDMIHIEHDDNEFYISKSAVKIKSIPSFLDYINSGLDMNLVCGIDFTASNGDPTHFNSLHYLGEADNQYTAAIRAVSKILLNFDTDQQVPLFGFGAIIPQFSTKVSHCFAMNGDIFSPEVHGVQGILDTYKNTLKTVNFSGPTYFAPLLSHWNEMAKAELEKDKKKYYIYLILTDGAIHDTDETVDCIVESSTLPISVIIVGIGDANFDTMNFLDADDERLFSRKHQKFQERDNVQFVKYNEFKDNPHGLARETLEELPRQMIDFYQSKDYDILTINQVTLDERMAFPVPTAGMMG